MRTPIALLLWGAAQVVGAQNNALADRHARILELQRAEDHPAVITTIEQQLRALPGTTWADSVHLYVQPLGNALWRHRNADAGIAAARRLVDQVMRTDAHVLHQLDAMTDLGELLFAMGRMADCARNDSIVVALGDRSQVPLLRRGMARQRLAFDHNQMGEYALALHHYLAAEQLMLKARPLPELQLGEVCSGAGAMYWRTGATDSAAHYYDKALAHLERSDDPKRNFRMAGVSINKGILWQDAGDLDRSKAGYFDGIRRCAAVADTAKDPALREEAILGRSRGYVNLATVYFSVGDDAHARQFLELALRDRRRYLEPDDPKLLGVLDRLADVEMEAQEWARAELHVRNYRDALARKYGAHGEDYARTCAKLGEIHAAMGRTVRADSLFQESIAVHRAMGGAETDVALASALRRYAQFLLAQGRPTDARQRIDEAIAILRRVQGDEHFKVAAYGLVAAEAAYAAQDATAAREQAVQTLLLMDERVKALRNSDLPRTWAQPHVLSDALYWKVKAERAMGIGDPVQWRSDLDLAVLALERNRAALEDEGAQLGFIGRQRNLFNLALDLAVEDHEREGGEVPLDRFLQLSEADRSILLKSRLNAFSSIRFAGVPDSIIQREQELVDALDVDAADVEDAAQLPAHEQELQRFLERLSQEHPQYFRLRYGSTSISIADVREHLITPERDLLAYAFTQGHLNILMIGSDTAALVRVDDTGISTAVKELHAAILSRDQPAYAHSAHRLHQLVFAPVAAYLRKPELLIIPDGELLTVNFEVLLDAPVTSGLGAHMLIQRHAIAYLLSATTAVQFAQLRERGKSDVLAFAPGFSDRMKRDYIEAQKDTTLLDDGYLHYVRQPFAVRTAEQLGSLFGARVHVGAEASEGNFRDQAREHGILHLGTHAEMNAASPLYSRLVLSKDGAGLEDAADGYLHAYEIYELDLRAQLAVLTACETGAGRDDGEGVRSLGYAFAYAGCPSLVMSLWNIDEKVSAEIIGRFYANLAEGMPKHQALRRAKLDHLAQAPDELALPYYWAGLVLVGDVEPMEISSWKRHRGWIIGGAMLLVVIGLGLWWRSRRAARP